MPKDERRKHDRAMKKKKQLEEDMLPEVMLREEIEMTKKRVNGKDPIYERVRAFVSIEGDEKQDYQVVCRFNELQVKGLKNGEQRLDPS